jgi:hypothetical protein
VDGTHYFGGQSTVGGVDKNDRQENARVGVTLSVPATPKHSLKFTWSKGASTRLGSNFTSYGVAWQYTWFDKPKP